MARTNAENLGVWNESKFTREDIQRRITSSSRELIEIRKGEGKTVQFIHETVNDFLLRNQRLRTLEPELGSNPIGASHDRLKACCITYFMTSELLVPREELRAGEISSIYPFLEYASYYVLNYAESAHRRAVAQNGFLRCLQQQHEHFEQLRRFYDAFKRGQIRVSDDATPLYILTSHRCDELVRIILYEEGADPNAQGGLFGNPLQAAVEARDRKIVAMLHENGANPNARGLETEVALTVAVNRQDWEMAAMLLEKGADLHINKLQLALALLPLFVILSSFFLCSI